MYVKNRIISGFLSTLIFLCSQSVIAGGDEYLSLLEAEAAESRIDSGVKANKQMLEKNHVYKSATNVNLKDWSGKCGSVENVLPSNIHWENFSNYLEQCSMTTFSLYRKLDNNLQRFIYERYSSIDYLRLDALRQEILKVYSRTGTSRSDSRKNYASF